MKKLAFRLTALFVVAVAFKWMLENSLHDSRVQLKLGGPPLSLELRTKLSQNFAVALLSGFRGIVADFVWIDAHRAWEDQNWFKLKEGIELTVVMQPHSISFWDIGGWHMAWNASYGVSTDPKLPNQAFKVKAQRTWIQAGKEFLEKGIQNNPDNYDLHFKLGWLIYQKLDDPMGSIEYFKKAADYPDAPLYVSRMVGHMYVKAGHTKEAYDWWKKLWAQDRTKNSGQLWYKIAQWGYEAEEKLDIPLAQRVFPVKQKSPEPPKTPPPPHKEPSLPGKNKPY